MGMLQDKVAVIIGAAGRDNMGQVIARRFAAEGARVVVAGRDEAALAELAEEIGGLAVRCDITDEGDLAALADAAVARSEEHTSELQSLMRISYAVFCLQKKKHKQTPQQ